MKKICNILFLSFITSVLFSQQSTLSVSDDFKVKDKGYKNQYISNSVHVDDFFFPFLQAIQAKLFFPLEEKGCAGLTMEKGIFIPIGAL